MSLSQPSDDEAQVARKRRKKGDGDDRNRDAFHLTLDEGARGDYGLLTQIIRRLGIKSKTLEFKIDKDDERVRSLEWKILRPIVVGGKDYHVATISVSILDEGNALKRLSISGTQVIYFGIKTMHLACEIGNLSSLEVLEINCSEPKDAMEISLPDQIGQLLSLRKLTLRELQSLPSSIVNLVNLKELTIVGKIHKMEDCDIPDGIGNLTSLESLNIGTWKNIIIPSSVGNLTNLKELQVANCNEVSLPDEIGKLTNLKEFQVANCYEVGLPDEMGNLTRLESLVATKTCLSSFPRFLGSLTNLKKIILSSTDHWCYAHDLPNEIGNLTNLKVLQISGSEIPSLPPSIGNLRNLEELNIKSDCNMETPPDEISSLVNLKFLTLSSKSFQSLPDAIGNLSNLKKLCLYDKNLALLPDSIANLSRLEELDLDGIRKLKRLPDAIGDLTNLKTLSLNSNKIRSLPDSICNLSSLEELHLRNTAQLKSLPNAIGNLTSLKCLNIEGSQISSLPNSIHKLLNLEVLNLGLDLIIEYRDRNRITTLTSIAQHCPYLGCFCLDIKDYDGEEFLYSLSEWLEYLLRRNRIRCRISRKPSPPLPSLWPLIFKMVRHESSYWSEKYFSYQDTHNFTLNESCQEDMIFSLLVEHCGTIFSRAPNASQSIAPQISNN